MRSLKRILRSHLLKVLRVTPAAVDDNVGSELVDGKGHREYIGGLWEGLGSLQFRFMIEQGLQPQHVLIDVACGSLRGGVRFIPYLDSGNYLGLDVKQELIDAGIQLELGSKLYEIKRPEFVVSESFEFDRFSKQPDFVLAQSLFTQLIERDILLCLRNLRDRAKPKTKFYATFHESEQPVENPAQSHPHKSFVYTRRKMIELGEASGWKTYYIGGWNHPRGQVMLEYSV